MDDKVEQKEAGGEWDSHILEYEDKESKAKNPIPSVKGPVTGDDRREKVPSSIETYLKNRYGSDVKVGVGNRFGQPDGSGYSYDVRLGGEKIAEIESRLTTINLLPPGYEGYLKKLVEDVQTENSLRKLTTDSRRAELVQTLWWAKESTKAQVLRKKQSTT